jgi:hypothetical protein
MSGFYEVSGRPPRPGQERRRGFQHPAYPGCLLWVWEDAAGAPLAAQWLLGERYVEVSAAGVRSGSTNRLRAPAGGLGRAKGLRTLHADDAGSADPQRVATLAEALARLADGGLPAAVADFLERALSAAAGVPSPPGSSRSTP